MDENEIFRRALKEAAFIVAVAVGVLLVLNSAII